MKNYANFSEFLLTRGIKRVCVVGATARALDFASQLDDLPVDVIDNYKHGQIIQGFQLKSLDSCVDDNAAYIVFTSPPSFESIMFNFVGAGIAYDSIFLHFDDAGILGFCNAGGSDNASLSAKTSAYLHHASQSYLYASTYARQPMQTMLNKLKLAFVGQLPENKVKQLAQLANNLQPVRFSRDDHAENYSFNHRICEQTEQDTNAHLLFYQPSAEFLNACFDACSEESLTFEAAYSGAWQIANVRVVGNRCEQPISSDGASKWHKDGMPVFVVKMLIYLDGAGSDIGTTEFDDGVAEQAVEVPDGGYLVFNPSLISHRAKYVQGKERRTIEVTITPRFNQDLAQTGVFAGNNALYPTLTGKCH